MEKVARERGGGEDSDLQNSRRGAPTLRGERGTFRGISRGTQLRTGVGTQRNSVVLKSTRVGA